METSKSLLCRVRDLIEEAIRRGEFAPGSKLPGDRRLAERFGTSRGTVIEALALLEKRQHLIERIPCRGTFVLPGAKLSLETLRLIFPFPEKSLYFDPGMVNSERWHILSETYRGLICGAKENNAEVTFQHFVDTDDDVLLANQLRSIAEFDGALFISGHMLAKLRRAVLSKYPMRCAEMYGNRYYAVRSKSIGFNDAANMQTLCRHVKSREYERIYILIREDMEPEGLPMRTSKLRLFSKTAAVAGLSIPEDGIIQTLPNKLGSLSLWGGLEPGRDAVYGENSDLLQAVYRLCAERRLSPGRDFGLFGYATGFLFENFMPELTYCRLAHFDVGRAAARYLCELIRKGCAKLPENILCGISEGGSL